MKRMTPRMLVWAWLGLLSATSLALAFDPIGPPPKKTLEWTVHVMRPRVLFEGATLEDACDGLMGVGSIPPSYSIKIDCSQIKVPKDWTIDMDQKDITIIKAVAIIAEKCNADMLVKPGVIILVPHEKS